MIKESIEILFPKTKDVDSVVQIIEKYRSKFGLNTNLRFAHFIAQVREEVGSEFEVRRENMNYSEEALPKVFAKFNKELAKQYGRNTEHKADREMIANIAYANRLGNSDVESGDGYRYRGAGCLQITGKSNFKEVQKRCVKYAGKEMDPNTLEGFIVFGMAYWIWRDLYKLADLGKYNVVIDNVTEKINKHTHSYAQRREYFNKIVHLV